MTTRPQQDKQHDKALEALKVPPHSTEAEQSILGGLMLDNHAWDRVADRVDEEDFYRNDHRLIFKALADLSNQDKPLDVLTVSEYLKSHQLLDKAGGEVYLFEIANNTPSAANITAYADIVQERSVLRKLVGVANDIADCAYRPKGRDSATLLDEAERRVFEIAGSKQRGSGPKDIQDILTSTVNRVDELYHQEDAITGLSTGFADLDEMTSGLQPADMVVIAGRPSMGKTAFSMNLAENVAVQSGKGVLVFSMEMPAESLAMRMMSSLGRINQKNIRSGKLDDDDWPRLTSAVSILSESKMYIDDTPALSPSELRARARRVMQKMDGQLGMIVIDYLQLMKVPGMSDNRVSEISEISRSLKALAKELNVPVIALSQLNRGLEQRNDKRPVMSDLRESGAIEQDADLIAFIYRDEVYHPETRDKGTAEIIIAKQRNGPIGKVRLTFLGQYTRFENFIPNQLDDGFSAME